MKTETNKTQNSETNKTQNSETKNKSIFKKILNRIHKRINFNGRTKPKDKFIFLNISFCF